MLRQNSAIRFGVFTEKFVPCGKFSAQGNGFSCFVDKAVGAFADRTQCICFCITYFVFDVKTHACIADEPSRDFYFVRESCHGLVFALYGQDGTEYALLFHDVIAYPHLFQHVAARLFHPAHIIGMMNDFHRICFIVLCFMDVGSESVHLKISWFCCIVNIITRKGKAVNADFKRNSLQLRVGYDILIYEKINGFGKAGHV